MVLKKIVSNLFKERIYDFNNVPENIKKLDTGHYLYLLRMKEFRSGDTIYKFGKTTRCPSNRIHEYGPSIDVLYIFKTFNCHLKEIEILESIKYNKKIKKIKGKRKEYFKVKNKKNIINDIMLHRKDLKILFSRYDYEFLNKHL